MPEEQTQNERQQEGSSGEQTQQARGMEALKTHILEHKVETLLWATRALTLIFCISYLIPVFG